MIRLYKNKNNIISYALPMTPGTQFFVYFFGNFFWKAYKRYKQNVFFPSLMFLSQLILTIPLRYSESLPVNKTTSKSSRALSWSDLCDTFSHVWYHAAARDRLTSNPKLCSNLPSHIISEGTPRIPSLRSGSLFPCCTSGGNFIALKTDTYYGWPRGVSSFQGTTW